LELRCQYFGQLWKEPALVQWLESWHEVAQPRSQETSLQKRKRKGYDKSQLTRGGAVWTSPYIFPTKGNRKAKQRLRFSDSRMKKKWPRSSMSSPWELR